MILCSLIVVLAVAIATLTKKKWAAILLIISLVTFFVFFVMAVRG